MRSLLDDFRGVSSAHFESLRLSYAISYVSQHFSEIYSYWIYVKIENLEILIGEIFFVCFSTERAVSTYFI